LGKGELGDGKGGEKRMGIGSHEERLRQRQRNGTYASTSSREMPDNPDSAFSEAGSKSNSQPHSHHPFLHSRLSRITQSILLATFDTVMILTLTAHITTYFISLPIAMTFCTIPAVANYPD
jgi:hypothetical protein